MKKDYFYPDKEFFVFAKKLCKMVFEAMALEDEKPDSFTIKQLQTFGRVMRDIGQGEVYSRDYEYIKSALKSAKAND